MAETLIERLADRLIEGADSLSFARLNAEQRAAANAYLAYRHEDLDPLESLRQLAHTLGRSDWFEAMVDEVRDIQAQTLPVPAGLLRGRPCLVCEKPESEHLEQCLCMWSVDADGTGLPFVQQLVIEDTVGGPGEAAPQWRAIWRKGDGAYQVDVWTVDPGAEPGSQASAPACQLTRLASPEELELIEAVRRRATSRVMADNSLAYPLASVEQARRCAAAHLDAAMSRVRLDPAHISDGMKALYEPPPFTPEQQAAFDEYKADPHADGALTRIMGALAPRWGKLGEAFSPPSDLGIWLNHPAQREWLQGAGGGAWYTHDRGVAERQLAVVNPLAAGLAVIRPLPADVARAEFAQSASTWPCLDEALHAAALVPSDEEREARQLYLADSFRVVRTKSGVTFERGPGVETAAGEPWRIAVEASADQIMADAMADVIADHIDDAPGLPDAGAGLEYGRAVKAKLAQLARDAGWSAHRAMEAKIDRAKIPDEAKALFEPFDSTPGVIPQAAGFTPINPAAYATPELIPVESFYPVPSCDVHPDVINHLTARYTDESGAHIVGLAPLSDPPTDDELVALADRLGDEAGRRLYRLLHARRIRL